MKINTLKRETSFVNRVVAGGVDTIVKKWIIKAGEPVTPGDLLCVVTFETYTGPVERNVLSKVYGTVGRINYLEGDTVPRGDAVCLIDLDDRYYTYRAISFLEEHGGSTLNYYEELLCKLAAPNVESVFRDEWIEELTDWTLAMKGIFDEYRLDKSKAVEHVISMYMEMDLMDRGASRGILARAASAGRIKGISEKDVNRIDLDHYGALVNGYLDYCRKIWTEPQKEDRSHALEMIRRIAGNRIR